MKWHYQASMAEFWQKLNQVNRHNIAQAPKSVQTVVLMLIIAVLAIFAWLVLISPQYDRLTAAHSQQLRLIDEFAQSHRQLGQFDATRQRLIDENTKLQARLSQLPVSAPMTQIVSELQSQAAMHQVRIQSASVQAMHMTPNVTERPIAVVATGSYHDLGQWLFALTQLPFLLAVSDFEITAEQGGRLRLTMTVLTFQANPKAQDMQAKGQ